MPSGITVNQQFIVLIKIVYGIWRVTCPILITEVTKV